MNQQCNARAELSRRQHDEGVGQQEVIGVRADRRSVDGAGAEAGEGRDRRRTLGSSTHSYWGPIQTFSDLANVDSFFSTIVRVPMRY
jgi:hypothetical protein